jgi:hypothetical protein
MFDDRFRVVGHVAHVAAQSAWHAVDREVSEFHGAADDST